MVNHLKMAKINAIKMLRQRGWSRRRIAETLGIDRRTVTRYLVDDSKCTNAPAGPEVPAADSKCTTAPPGPEPSIETDRSACSAYRDAIVGLLEIGLSATRIHQDLASEHGFKGSYYSVKRYVRQLRDSKSLPFRRIESPPGHEAQVDFGTGAPVVDEQGRRRRTHVLRVVLSFSRKGYSEVVYRQTTDNFIQCLENAFHYLGGVPNTLVIDNLRAAVKKADWFDPEINPKVESFARHYGTIILPTKPRMPRHKGKVERGVDYVQENALKGKTFASLAAQNTYLIEWEARVADTRIHGTTKKHVGNYFREMEQAALQSLPPERFPFFSEARRRVNRDGHIEVDKAYYSLPPEYLGNEVWVRWNSQVVRVYDERMREITIHVRQEPGRFSTHGPHIATEKVNGVERGAKYLLRKACILGPQTARWSEAMIADRGIAGVRVLQGLLSLAKQYSSDAIEEACEIAWSHQAFHLRTLRSLLKRAGDRQVTMEFLDEHPIIRPMSEYGDLVRKSFQGE